MAGHPLAHRGSVCGLIRGENGLAVVEFHEYEATVAMQTDQQESSGRIRLASGLRRLLILFGSVCMAIGFVHIALGPGAIIGGVPVNPTMDGEDHFFGALFSGFRFGLI